MKRIGSGHFIREDRWISCNERLPEQNEHEYKCYLIQDEYGDMYVAHYTNKGWHPMDGLFFLNNIVAWMPLPERYKAESEKENP